jgi:hypothetical protein
MNPMLAAFLTAALRHVLTGVFGALVARGVITEEQGAMFMAGLIGWLLVVGWSLWQKYKGRIRFLAALEAEPGTPEHEVK